MLHNIEPIASGARLHFSTNDEVWSYDDDWPHIARFRYTLRVRNGKTERLKVVGKADGYRITQDWTADGDLHIWDQADALDGDIVRYVEALIREVRACEAVFQFAPDLSMAQRVTIVRHVEAAQQLDSADLIQAAVASLGMIDAPVLMLVDPWPMAEERRSPRGKLKGRSHPRQDD